MRGRELADEKKRSIKTNLREISRAINSGFTRQVDSGQHFIECRIGSIDHSDENLEASEAAGRTRAYDEGISVGFRCAMMGGRKVGRVVKCVIYIFSWWRGGMEGNFTGSFGGVYTCTKVP